MKLRAHLGDGFPLAKVKDRLRCERCSSQQIVATFLTPNQRTGNVAYLFSLPPPEALTGDVKAPVVLRRL